MADLTYCLAEDRRDEETGLRLTLCGLRRHQPHDPVVVYRPDPTPDFVTWLGGFPQVRLVPDRPPGGTSWNCKPQALIPLLEAGAGAAVWLDSDLALARPCGPLFVDLDRDVLVVAEEPVSLPLQGGDLRTRGWAFPVGRTFPRTANTCVIGTTSAHLPLLRRWRDLLAEPAYVRAQTLPMHERPTHFLSDQDVLNAVIGSAEFAHIPVRFLRTGRDVIHAGGALAYSLGERVAGLVRPVPPFIHGQGTKPWYAFAPAFRAGHPGWFGRYRGWLQEVSPYVAEARRYRNELGIDTPWLDYRTAFGLVNRWAGLGHFALRGLPLTVVATVLTTAGRLIRQGRK